MTQPITFDNIPDLIKNHQRHYYGQVNIDAEYPQDLDEIWNWALILPKADVTERLNLRMFEFHRLEQQNFISPILMEIHKRLNSITEMTVSPSPMVTGNYSNGDCVQIVGFLAADEQCKGYNLHDDYMHLVAFNVIGSTVWTFEDGSTQHMQPGDAMFVPSGMKHAVSGYGERFTVSFCSSYEVTSIDRLKEKT